MPQNNVRPHNCCCPSIVRPIAFRYRYLFTAAAATTAPNFLCCYLAGKLSRFGVDWCRQTRGTARATEIAWVANLFCRTETGSTAPRARLFPSPSFIIRASSLNSIVTRWSNRADRRYSVLFCVFRVIRVDQVIPETRSIRRKKNLKQSSREFRACHSTELQNSGRAHQFCLFCVLILSGKTLMSHTWTIIIWTAHRAILSMVVACDLSL